MTMQLTIQKPYAFSGIGRRSNNEDALFPEKGCADERTRLFIVCDGIGGYEGGEIVSNAVCKFLSAFILKYKTFDKEVFLEALDKTYNQLYKMCDSGQIEADAGTTLTMLYLYEKGAFMAHIGDSRIYHLRRTENKTIILFQSEDHSYVNELVKSGIITPEKALTHSKRNLITKSIHARRDLKDEADMYITDDVKKGDCFLLCTDGMLEGITNEKLCSIVANYVSVEKIGQAIVDICQKESSDNFSGYLISVDSVDYAGGK